MTVLWLVGLCIIGLIIWGAHSARKVLYPERLAFVPPQSLQMHNAHVLSAKDGTPLEVWRFEPLSPQGRVLAIHGYYASRYQVFGIAQGLSERGYEVLVFELRGHGNRPGPCTFGVQEAEDATIILKWVKEEYGALPTAILGLSMGAAVACQVALGHPEIRAVVADSIYARFYPVVRFNVWRRYHLSAFPWAWVTWLSLRVAVRRLPIAVDPMAIVTRLSQPALFIQGGKDRVVASDDWESVYRSWGGSKERWFEPDVEHVGMYFRDPGMYQNRVAAFLDKTLK